MSPSPRLDQMRDLVLAQVGGAGLGERGPHLLEQRPVALEAGLLAQVAEASPLRHPGAAFVRLVLAGDDAQERRLAGAVRADEPSALALADGERDVVQHVQPAERASDGFREQHVFKYPVASSK